MAYPNWRVHSATRLGTAVGHLLVFKSRRSLVRLGMVDRCSICLATRSLGSGWCSGRLGTADLRLGVHAPSIHVVDGSEGFRFSRADAPLRWRLLAAPPCASACLDFVAICSGHRSPNPRPERAHPIGMAA